MTNASAKACDSAERFYEQRHADTRVLPLRETRARLGAAAASATTINLALKATCVPLARKAAQIDVLRAIRERHAVSCAFLSVEPLIGPVDACDFAGMDWILIGGESGPRCRDMKLSWLEAAIAKAQAVDAAIWFKQYGHERNNPYVQSIVVSQGTTARAAFARAVAEGLELAAEEKGGATFDGRTYRQLPRSWFALRDRMRVS